MVARARICKLAIKATIQHPTAAYDFRCRGDSHDRRGGFQTRPGLAAVPGRVWNPPLQDKLNRGGML